MRARALIATAFLTACASTASHGNGAASGHSTAAASIPCESVFFFEHKRIDAGGHITLSGAAAVTAHACVANDVLDLPEPYHYQVSIDSNSPQQVTFDLTVAGEPLTTTIALPPRLRVVLDERPLTSGDGTILVTVIAFESMDEMRSWMASRMGFVADSARDRTQ